MSGKGLILGGVSLVLAAYAFVLVKRRRQALTVATDMAPIRRRQPLKDRMLQTLQFSVVPLTAYSTYANYQLMTLYVRDTTSLTASLSHVLFPVCVVLFVFSISVNFLVIRQLFVMERTSNPAFQRHFYAHSTAVGVFCSLALFRFDCLQLCACRAFEWPSLSAPISVPFRYKLCKWMTREVYIADVPWLVVSGIALLTTSQAGDLGKQSASERVAYVLGLKVLLILRTALTTQIEAAMLDPASQERLLLDDFANPDRNHVLADRNKGLRQEWFIPRAELALGRVISSGSFSQVFEAQLAGQGVAVKAVLQKDAAGSAEQGAAKVDLEARLLAQLHHTNVVRFLGLSFGDPGNVLLIVTELLHLDLYTLLQQDNSARGCESSSRWLAFANDICCGMRFVAAKGIIHRDLKPTNVLVSKAGVCKICDFGISAVLYNTHAGLATQIQTANQGTLAYAAPETRCTPARYSSAADVYSFGITLWTMWTGRVPSLAESADRPPKPNDCPRRVTDFMKACWHEEPKLRPSFGGMQGFFDEVEVGAGSVERSEEGWHSNGTLQSSFGGSRPGYDSVVSNRSFAKFVDGYTAGSTGVDSLIQ
jgi:tRNA A-37 threonylcarbamoyl transferase component Bud32